MSGPRAQEPSLPSLADADESRVGVAGGELFVRVEGRGADLLLIHGLTAHGEEWNAVRGLLRPRFRIVTPDLLGRGRSSVDPGAGYGLAEETDRLLELATRIGLRTPFVAGHSHGALLAVALAGRLPCSGLLLLNPVTPWTRRPWSLDALRLEAVLRVSALLLRPFRRHLTRVILSRRVYATPDDHLESAVDRYGEPWAGSDRSRILLRVLRDWRPSELGDPWLPVHLPVRVLAGGRDRRTTPEEAGRWARRLGGTADTLAGCAHGIPEEAPRRVAAEIEALRRESESRERGRG
jgi:pimeloyl-ACP methyl ester carboxylesterase